MHRALGGRGHTERRSGFRYHGGTTPISTTRRLRRKSFYRYWLRLFCGVQSGSRRWFAVTATMKQWYKQLTETTVANRTWRTCYAVYSLLRRSISFVAQPSTCQEPKTGSRMPFPAITSACSGGWPPRLIKNKQQSVKSWSRA